MAKKNRPTLKQQFNDFINRVAPFDSNPLIQKSEHLNVESDLFDSIILKEENPFDINAPGSNIALDFDVIDSYSINSQASIDVNFTLDVTNLSGGQVGRVEVIKKTNDVFSVNGFDIANISNLSQQGNIINFYIVNVRGNLIPFSDQRIQKSDNISDNNTNQLATSKAVSDLNDSLISSRSAKDQGLYTNLVSNAGGAFNEISYTVKARETDQGIVQIVGNAEYEQPGSASSFINLGTLPLNLRPDRDMHLQIGLLNSFINTTSVYIGSASGGIVAFSPGNGNTRGYGFNIFYQRLI